MNGCPSFDGSNLVEKPSFYSGGAGGTSRMRKRMRKTRTRREEMDGTGEQGSIMSFLRREIYMNAYVKPGAWPSSTCAEYLHHI